jgi:hypothetical protein
MNASYVFFTSSRSATRHGSARRPDLPLIPEASLAVDLTVHALIPVWSDDSAGSDTAKPDQRFHRLLVMQDTGGAIRGPVRGDVYWGYSPTRVIRPDAKRGPDERVVAEKRATPRAECRFRPAGGDALRAR